MDEVRSPSWHSIHPILRLLGSALFLVWIGTVAYSGFAWPIGRSDLSFWPWNQSWFMFYKSTGYHYYLQIKGVREDGAPATVSFEDYFKFPSAFHSPRFNEIQREPMVVRRLANYVCRKYNAKAVPGARLARVTVWDSWWPDRRGLRRTIQQVSPNEIQIHTYLDNESCDRLQMESSG